MSRRNRSTRKNRKQSQPTKSEQNVATRIRLTISWKVLSAILGTLATIIVAFLINAPTILSNTRNIPEEYEKTRDMILGKYYSDSEWTGLSRNTSQVIDLR
jgi:hypothetical protein